MVLSYNLALASHLKAMAERRPPRRGTVSVRSWESVARGMFGAAGFTWAPPGDAEARRHYYEEVVPGIMAEVVPAENFVPAYDALVVDEAQDHDTGFLGEAPAGFTAGWWSVEVYCESEDKVADRVKAIVTKWIGTGYCKIDDILVLSPHAKQESTAKKAAPGWTTSWGQSCPAAFGSGAHAEEVKARFALPQEPESGRSIPIPSETPDQAINLLAGAWQPVSNAARHRRGG